MNAHHYSYLTVILLIIFFTLTIDLKISKIIIKFPTKFIIYEIFMFGVLFLQMYTGIKMGLWEYSGQGILQYYLLDIPIEEYFYMLIAPYTAIVIWESFHKLNIRKNKK